MQMEKIINRIYIDAPATLSTGRSNEFLNGELIIPRCNESEKINVAVIIGRKPSNFAQWPQILATQTPQTKTKSFVITKEDWISTGLIWVIPTSIYETNPIKIQIGGNSLLDSGFTIQIHSRDTIITREVAASTELAKGATISFTIDWTISANATLATPVVETAV